MIFNNQWIVLTSEASDLESKARLLGFDAQFLISVGLHMLTVLILFYILGRLMFKPIQKILDDRKKTIAGEFSRIQKESEQAAAMKAEYEIKLSEIKKEAEGILTKARRKALEQENIILDNAHLEAQRMVARADQQIKHDVEQAREEMRREIIEVATRMAEQFVAVSMDDSAKNAIFEKALDEMGDTSWLN